MQAIQLYPLRFINAIVAMEVIKNGISFILLFDGKFSLAQMQCGSLPISNEIK